MYHPDIIARRETQLFEERPALRGTFPHGLEPYAVSDSQALTKQISDAHDEKGDPLRRLSPEEERFLAISRLRSAIDYPYFAERFVWIDEGGAGIRPLYPLWESQRFTLERLGTLEKQRIDAGYPDGLLANVLKARQLGISTLGESLVAHRLLTSMHQRGLSGADVEEQAGYLFRMVRRMYDQLPIFLRPTLSSFVKNREMSFGNFSYLRTAWGKSTRGALADVGGEGSKGAIGRGQTFSKVHISELATWDNPSQLDGALLPAIPESPQTLVLFESTAEHAQDWWHKHWLATEEGNGRFINIFIPWYVEPGKYSRPAPEGWVPQPSTVRHVAKCERESTRWLGRPYVLTREQAFWYESQRAYYLKKNELHKFLKEFPADDQECFQYAGRAIFSFEQLEAIDAAGSRRPLLDVWRVEPSREIAALRRETESQAQTDAQLAARARALPPLAPRLPAARGPAAATEHPVPPGYGFQRLRREELAELPNLRHGVLAIWEYPRARGTREYVMAVDVGDGVGQDYSVIDVIRQATIEEPAEQVAQWCSNRHDTKALAFVCDAIGRFYVNPDGIEALAAVESNNHGLATVEMLASHLGYGHLYVREDLEAASAERRTTVKLGWHTSTRTRPILIAAFYAAITNFDESVVPAVPDFILNSPITRGELRHFVTEGTIGEAEAAGGQHDDAILAAAIGYHVAWRRAGGETEPIDEKRKRRAAMRRDAELSLEKQRVDYRNSPVTAQEVHDGLEDEDEFQDDVAIAGSGSLSFFGSGHWGRRDRA